MKRVFLLIFVFLQINSVMAGQADSSKVEPISNDKSIFKPKRNRNFSRKGDFYFHWGYNFSWYGKSDLNFNGPGYNFTLKQIVAHDRPTKFGRQYFDPGQISIPQFNFHFGYFIKDNYSISLGWDHMKYVMDIPQQVKVSGYINSSISEPAIPTNSYEGTYDNSLTTINEDMLKFEHTDGFNYASVELERYDDIWVTPSGRRSLTLETGLGAGVLLPRSDVRLFNVGQNNYWNLAGYGISAKAGLKLYLLKKIYLQNSLKIGWTDLSNIHTTGRNKTDRASQKISYLENYTVLGFQF